MIIDLILYRFEQTPTHTLGELIGKDNNKHAMHLCYTIELPWVANRRNISCIPSGIYRYEVSISPSFGKIVKLLNVPRRSHILIHVGNYQKDTKGCILPNWSYSYTRDSKTAYGISSRDALELILESIPVKGNIHVISQN